MICKKLIDPDDGQFWYLFYKKSSDDSPHMVMSERQAKLFMEEMERDLAEREDEDEGSPEGNA